MCISACPKDIRCRPPPPDDDDDEERKQRGGGSGGRWKSFLNWTSTLAYSSSSSGGRFVSHSLLSIPVAAAAVHGRKRQGVSVWPLGSFGEMPTTNFTIHPLNSLAHRRRHARICNVRIFSFPFTISTTTIHHHPLPPLLLWCVASYRVSR